MTDGMQYGVADGDRSPVGVDGLTFGCCGDDVPVVWIQDGRDLVRCEHEVGKVGAAHRGSQIRRVVTDDEERSAWADGCGQPAVQRLERWAG